jgi:hypothetical protein
LHGVWASDHHAHQDTEPREGEESEEHQGHDLDSPADAEVRSPAERKPEAGDDHDAEDLFDDLPDHLGRYDRHAGDGQ